MVHLTETIEEAWRETVTQVAQAEGEVQELARLMVDIPLQEEMGDAALAMMDRLMAGEFEEYEAWREDEEGNFRRELDQVTLVYTPGSGQLAVEARLTELITAEVEAAADAAGFTVGDVAAEAVGRYYDDGWGGRTRERADREARVEAERRLEAARTALHRQQHAAELAAAETEARTEAEAEAEAELERLRAETRDALRRRLQVILADAQDEVYLTMNRLVGEAYRRSLIELALQNGGRVVSDERTGSVINLELELY
jgi:hypothetical protein